MQSRTQYSTCSPQNSSCLVVRMCARWSEGRGFKSYLGPIVRVQGIGSEDLHLHRVFITWKEDKVIIHKLTRENERYKKDGCLFGRKSSPRKTDVLFWVRIGYEILSIVSIESRNYMEVGWTNIIITVSAWIRISIIMWSYLCCHQREHYTFTFCPGRVDSRLHFSWLRMKGISRI